MLVSTLHQLDLEEGCSVDNLLYGKTATQVFQVVACVFQDNFASWGSGLGFAVVIRGPVSPQTTYFFVLTCK